MLENLSVLFLLAGCMLGTWWGLIRLVNKSLGYDLRTIYDKIYEDPLAASILRVGVMYTVAYLVSSAFSRFV